MNKQFLVAALGAALALPASLAAQADGVMGGTDFTVYGRVVAGIDRQDTDVQGESATWDLGATGFDGNRNQGSRLGFMADRDLDNGMTTGFKLEQQFDGGGGPNNSRHRYVYLNGGFGNLSIGNANGPYANTSYDQSYFLGGSFRAGSDRREGIHYSNSAGGFNFGLSVTGNNGSVSNVTFFDPDEHDDYLRDRHLFDTGLHSAANDERARTARPQETEAAYLARVLAALARVPVVANSDTTGIDADDRARAAAEMYADADTPMQRAAKDLVYANRLRTQIVGLDYVAAARDSNNIPIDNDLNNNVQTRRAAVTAVAGMAETTVEREARLQTEINEAIDNLPTGAEIPDRLPGETALAYANRLNQVALANRAASERVADEDIDRVIIGAGYKFSDLLSLNVAYDGDNTDTDRDITAVRVNGAVGPLSYFVGYEQQDDARPNGENDHSTIGLFLSYAATDNDTVYLEYESRDDDSPNAGRPSEINGTMTTDEGGTATVLGYSRTLGGGAIFVAEYRSRDNDADVGDPSRLALGMIVNF